MEMAGGSRHRVPFATQVRRKRAEFLVASGNTGLDEAARSRGVGAASVDAYRITAACAGASESAVVGKYPAALLQRDAPSEKFETRRARQRDPWQLVLLRRRMRTLYRNAPAYPANKISAIYRENQGMRNKPASGARQSAKLIRCTNPLFGPRDRRDDRSH
jgi:hypothetical protein